MSVLVLYCTVLYCTVLYCTDAAVFLFNSKQSPPSLCWYWYCEDIVAVAVTVEEDNPADEETGVNTNTTPLNILILSAA